MEDGEDIRRECLEVWSEEAEAPLAVRQAWSNQPNGNAYGLRWLPVAPFRTDDWPFILPIPGWLSEAEKGRREKANELVVREREAWRRDRLRREARRVLDDLGE